MSTNEIQPVLSVRDLSVAFRVDGVWQPAVEQLSFDVGARQTVAIVGESGSGKSVTALSIMRLLPVTNSRFEGTIRLDGRDILKLPEEQMRDVRGDTVSMIFQEPMTSLNPVLTIGFQIAEALIHHRGLDRAAAEAETVRILERVRVPAARQRLHEYPHRFSGGMRQRVMIAMALACKPKLLIADEPTTALDVTVQAQILELIKLLQDEEGMSVIFITHDMGVVAEIADRVVVMWKGRGVEEGPAARVLTAARHPYTQALLAAVPRLGSMKGEARPKPFPEPDVEAVSSEATASLDMVREDRKSSERTLPSSMVSQALRPASAPPTGPANGEDARTSLEFTWDTSRPILEVANLATRFPIRSGVFGRVSGRVHAVENVSFSLRAGETLALVGESGCGKSTTGRSILRLVEPNEGRVLFEGQDVRALDAPGLRTMRRRMQMIFQDPFASLNPRKNVGAAIAEPIIVHGLAGKGEARDRVAELMRKVGLSPDMAGRFPHEFSGGQRQRLAIARALGLAPKLIVADEAVSALDVSVKARVVNLMMRLQAEMGLAFLFISHDIAVVERVSHRIAVMFLGEIVEIGSRAAIIENPCHPYTKKLIAAVPSPDPARRQIRRGMSNEEVPSPVRPASFVPVPRLYREVSPGHVVQEFAA
jgi:peptide/nickel transport system ATP-binding protein